MSSVETQARAFVDEVRCGLEKNWMLDLGHPLLNRIAESFVKAAGIGAVQAAARESYFMAIDGEGGSVSGTTGSRKRSFPELNGTNSSKSVEAMVKSVSKESLQWGLAAGVHSGLTYGLTEVRGAHDWRNSAVAGAITGAAVALTSDCASREQVVQCAIAGAALSTAANVLSGIF
ncbi:outer envelope pore protein 16-2, chloroplastic [Phragmites australis]|uniref:outer envelope pore protein 16-2, chloroplastic n=1 Tax=Phragmites australis TaxID=29695 RepID=UPI002D783C5C|nr:outer envelope pore protein 16-2, chloroplastic [Phragmites australis]